MFIVSSQVRFSFLILDLIILSQVDTGLPQGIWNGEIAQLNTLFAGVESSALITIPNHFSRLFR